MIKFNEYVPQGGWIKYRKRQEIKERVKVALLVFGLLLAYCLACGIVEYIEGGASVEEETCYLKSGANKLIAKQFKEAASGNPK